MSATPSPTSHNLRPKVGELQGTLSWTIIQTKLLLGDAKPPTDVKTIRSFLGLCNFFWTHIKKFAIIAAPLFRLTRKDSCYKGGPLPKDSMAAFCTLQNLLMSEPIMAFPRADRQYALITDAATRTADAAGSLGAILTQ